MTISRGLGLISLSVLGLAACGSSGTQGPAGAEGPPGPAGTGTATASVSGVIPSHAFLARKAEVTLSGFGTNWTKDTKVDFGPDVTVDNVQVASPTALVVSITIGKAAAAGPRDVSVTDGSTKIVYASGFRVDSPIAAKTIGTAAQGSIFLLHVDNKDLATPFDTTQTGDGLFSPLVYTNLAATVGAGIDASVHNVSVFGADMLLFVDVTAPAADQALSIVSGPKGAKDNAEFPLPKAFPVAARKATTLAAGTPASGSISEAFGSALYQFTPGATLNVVDFVAAAAGTGKAPSITLLPKSGKFADRLGVGASKTVAASTADPFYLIYWDNTGEVGPHTVTATQTAATGVPRAQSNTARSNAQAATTLPFVLQEAKLASTSDQAWISYTAAVGDVGKKIRVQTVGGDPKTDTQVQIFQSDGTTSISGADPVDRDYHEDVLSSALPAAGVYYIAITASSVYDSLHQDYQVIVRLQP